ncbi:MAG: EI24 domain-containing protein [Nitrosomonas sp.]|nr:MAG: EI24 domain-containing protein [Nitrosomonas sp.]
MSFVFNATISALRDLLRFKIAWIIIWPILAATVVWISIGIIFKEQFYELIVLLLEYIGIGEWLRSLQHDWITSAIIGLIDVLIFIPLIVVTTLIITAIFVTPALIKLVANRHHPDLKRKNGGTLSGTLLNTMLATGAFILIWLITLPLWPLGIGFFVPFVAAAFMNQQLFRYDALSEHATKEEINQICTEHRLSLWGLGLLTGLIQFVPFLNLLAPTFTALAFIHFGLEHLKRLRHRNAMIVQSPDHA